MKKKRKFIRKMILIVLSFAICVSALTACAASEAKNTIETKYEDGSKMQAEQDADEDKDAESELAAKWLDMENDGKARKRAKLIGDTLYWAEWNYNIPEKKTENLKVCASSSGVGMRELFAKEDITFYDFFLSKDGGRICYLYADGEELMLRADELGSDGGYSSTISVLCVDDESVRDVLLSNVIYDSVIDDENTLWIINADNKLVKISLSEDGGTAAAKVVQSVGDALLYLDGVVYVYTLENNLLTLYNADDMCRAGEYDFEAEGLVRQTHTVTSDGLLADVRTGAARLLGCDGKDFFVLCGNDIIDCTWNDGIFSVKGSVSVEKSGVDVNAIERIGNAGGTYYLYVVESGDNDGGSIVALLDNRDLTKIYLELACVSGAQDSDLKKLIDKYNRYSEDYCIEIKKYDSTDVFYLDMVKGKTADIFLLNHMQVDILEDKGILEDLTSYYEAGTVVSLDALEPSVVRACGRNGGQYMVMDGFTVSGYFFKEEYSDYLENGVLSTQAMYDILMEHPSMGIVSEHRAWIENTFYNELLMEVGSYIDWDELTCSFDEGGFAELLEKVAEIGESREYNDLYELYMKNGFSTDYIAEKMYNDLSLLGQTGISVYELLNMKGTMLEFCDIVGYPGSFDTPHYRMVPTRLFGMSRSSECKEGVWDFFEYLYSEGVQRLYNVNGSGNLAARHDFSPLKRYNQEVYEAAVAGTLDCQQSYHHITNPYSGERYEGAGLLGESDIAFIKYAVDNAYIEDSLRDETLTYILYEELGMFFAGDKSAQDTARVVQQRMELYLGE